MNTEQLDEFVSERALKQIADLDAALQSAADEMVTLTTQAQKMVNTIGGSANFAQFINTVQKVSDVNVKFAESTAKATVSVKAYQQGLAELTPTLQKNVQGQLDAKAAIEGATLNMQKAKAAMAEGKISGDAYAASIERNTLALSRAKVDLLDYTNAINAEIKAQNLSTIQTQAATAESITNRLAVAANSAELKKQIQLQNAVPGSIAEARLQSQLYRSELNNLNLTTEEGVKRQQELIAAIAEKDTFIKNNVDAYTAQKINIGNYPDASGQLTKMTAELEGLRAAGLEDSAEFKALSASANQLQAAMGGVAAELSLVVKTMAEMTLAGKAGSAEFNDLASRGAQLDAAMKSARGTISGLGDSTVTVTAQMSLMKNRLTELKVAGEGESEEARTLTAELRRLATAVAEVNESVKVGNDIGTKFTNIVEKMGLRMIANMAIFQVAISGFQMFWEWLNKVSDAEQIQIDRLNDFTGALKTFQRTVADMPTNIMSGIAIDTENSKSLVDIMTDQTQAIEARTAAYNKLQGIMPGLFHNMTQEQALSEKNVQAIRAHANAIIDLQNNINEIVKARDQAQKLLDQATASQTAVESTYSGTVNDPNKEKTAIINGLKDKVKGYNADLFAKNADLAKVNSPDIADKKASADNSLKMEQDLTKAIAEEQAKRLEIEAEKQKMIADNEKNSYTERLNAYIAYTDKQYEATVTRYNAEEKVISEALGKIKQLEGTEAAGGKLTAADKKLLDSKELLQQQLKTINANFDLYQVKEQEKTAKGIADIQQGEVKKRLDGLKTLDEKAKESQVKQETDLLALLNKGEIDYEEYTDKKKKLDTEYNIARLEGEIKYLEVAKAGLAAMQIDTKAVQDAIDKLKLSLGQAKLAAGEGDAAKVEAANKQIKDLGQQAVNQALSTGKDLLDGYYEKQLAYQQKVLDNITTQASLEKDSINASLASQQKKNQEILILDARTAAQQKQIQLEMNRIKREQAIADRVASILNATEQFAIAEIGALKLLADPITAPAYPAIAALMAGVYTLQTAAILAKPLPAYAEGIGYGGKGSHPGGMALVGEAGPELVVDKGVAKMVSSPVVIDLSTAARVIPEKDLILGGMGGLTPQLMQSISMQSDNAAVVSALGDVKDILRSLPGAIPQTTWRQTPDGWMKQVRTGSGTIDYLNKNLC